MKDSIFPIVPVRVDLAIGLVLIVAGLSVEQFIFDNTPTAPASVEYAEQANGGDNE